MPGANTYQLLISQAVQIQVEGMAEPLCGVVTNTLAEEMVVRFPTLPQLPRGLAAGSSIVLRCADSAGLHTGKTVVVEAFASPKPGVVLRNPQHFDLIQNRRFFRVEVSLPCSLQHMGESGLPMARDMDDKATIRDISAGGARVSTRCRVVVGEKVRLECLDPPAPIKARIVRVSELTCDPPGVLQVGMEFEDLGKETQDRLVAMIFEVQRSMCQRR